MTNNKPMTSELQTNTYLWAAHPAAAQFLFPQRVGDRFAVLAPQIWQDTTPHLTLPLPQPIPENVIPYLQLFSKSLHVPEVYGLCEVEGESILLLRNAPIDRQGNLYPTLQQAWFDASPTRQLYWLWQILNLWTVLAEWGVAGSVLVGENVRVEGWRVRLRELVSDRILSPNVSAVRPSSTASGVTMVDAPVKGGLPQLGESWEPLLSSASREIQPFLEEIVAGLKTEGVPLKSIANALNEILLSQGAKQPLSVRVAGNSDRGRLPSHNEDSFYPAATDFVVDGASLPERLSSHLFMVCDGIGGHEGGEVASHMAVQSIKLQARSLLVELLEDPKVMTPELVEEQLAAIVRIANNAIAARNDEQGRSSRQRMATTLTMAFQLPQQIALPDSKSSNGHELYIAHVGDSRAYWITPNYCQQLTVDDDVAAREVRAGRSLYREARAAAGSEALTQALGTRSADSLRPTVQRLIVEEDGVLLLCSDGMSDSGVLEDSWQAFVPPVIRGQISLDSAVEALIRRANEKNGRDNISVVAAFYSVSPQPPVLVNLAELPKSEVDVEEGMELEPPLAIRDRAVPVPEEGEAMDVGDGVAPEETEIEETIEGEKFTFSLNQLSWGVKLVLLVVAIGVFAILLRWSVDPVPQQEQPSSSPAPESVEE
ncbi:MAG: protein phosphatase 2C domain-containing protein [Cyanobacteriota bacterium]|nr:protein phosphatase 2C domain-containing protein [Cyanobacteriota bacterium]